MRKLLSNLRLRLILLVLLALAPVFVLAFFNRYEQRQQSARLAQTQARELAQRAARDHHELIGAAHQLLLPLAQSAWLRAADATVCPDLFDALRRHSTLFANLGLLDAQGKIICATTPPEPSLDLRARPYWTRALQRQVTLGEFEIGVIAGAPTINIALPIVDDTQHVYGIVFASLDSTWVRGFADAQKMPADSTLVVATAQNALGIRYPDLHVLEMSPLTSAQITQWRSEPSQTIERADADGITRLYAFTPLSPTDYLGIGLPTATVYAEIDRLAYRDLALLFLVTILAFCLAWLYSDIFITRRVRAILRATRCLAAGDLSARTDQPYGISELSELARAFDEMAATLQQRAAEQKNAVEALRQQAEEFAAITQVSRQVTSVSDLDQVLSVIARLTAELAQTDASGVYLADSAGVLRLQASYGVGPAFRDAVRALGVQPPKGAVGRAIVERRPIQITDVEGVPEYPFHDLTRSEGIRAILAVPMIRNDHITGGIVLWHRQPRTFAPSEIAFLQAIAQQCVNAIENARLLQAERAARELAEALRDTAAALSSTLNFDEVLDRILENVERVVPYDSVNLMLVEQDQARVVRVKTRAAGNFTLTPLLRIPQTPNLRQMIATSQAHLIADTQNDPIWIEFPETRWIRSHLGAPICLKGKVIGFLNLDSATPNFFNATHIPRLQAFADQAALALENARLLQETQTRAEQLTLLYDAGLALNSTLKPATQIEYLLTIARRALQADCVSFFRYDDARARLIPECCIGYTAEGAARWHSLTFHLEDQDNVISWVAAHRLPLNLPDAPADSRYIPIDAELRSGLWMPIERDQRLLGVMGVLSTRHDAFSPAMERLLALFANQAAIALENARLFDELQSSLQMLTRLYDLSNQMLTADTVTEIAQRAASILHASFDATAAWVHLLDAQGQVTFSYGAGEFTTTDDWTPRPNGLTQRVWQSGQPLFVNNPQLLHPAARAHQIQSAIVLPLRDSPVNLGVLFLIYQTPRPSAEQETELLTLFANQVALAIKRARLSAETRRRADQLAILNRIANVINQPARLDDLLHTIHREIVQLLPCDAFFIALYDSETDELDYRIRVDEGVVEPPGRYRLQESLGAHVIRQQRPLLIRDRENDARFPLMPNTLWGTMKHARAWLGVPIQLGENTIGVISVQAYTANVYSEEDAQLLATIADQIAVAIQRARLFEETQQRVAELETLNDISSVLRTTLTTREILPALLDATLRGLNAHDGLAILYDVEHAVLDEIVARGWLDQMDHRLTYTPAGIIGHVITTSEVYVTRDFRTDPLTREQARAHIPAGWGGICAPICATQKTIGILLVAVPAPRHIQPNEIRLVRTIAEMAGNALHRAELYEQTERHLRRLHTLRTIDTTISASLDLRVTLNILLDQLTIQLGADAANVLVLNPLTHDLEYAASQGFRTAAPFAQRLRLDEGYPARAVAESHIVHHANLASLTDPRIELFADDNFIAYYAAPLISKGQLNGVLELFFRTPHQATTEWLEFLDTLAGQTAIAIELANLLTSLQRSNIELTAAYDSTIEGWSRVLDLRDQETEGHTQRVATLAVRLASAMGLAGDELANLRRGALLHDIGKMAVSDRILHKQGELTPAEMREMQRHPQYAYEMLSSIAYLRNALDIPYCHHEKWDGTGYPRGLRGEAIPLAARIFAVVDVWDALTSERPYRTAWSAAQARAYLQEQAGKYFDPRIVEVFLRLLDSDVPPNA
jgi:putative nucleotidyltransferase with HDIG domain